MYDTPHLLKSVRNNLMKYNFCTDSGVVKWQYIQEFYKSDKAMNIRLAPKLSDKHVYCNTFEKMRVRLASQVLSRTVAAGIYTHSVLGALPPEASATASFWYNMDILFDMFDSSQVKHYRSAKCAFSSEHLTQIEEMEQWLYFWN